jgi:hypothetical protein
VTRKPRQPRPPKSTNRPELDVRTPEVIYDDWAPHTFTDPKFLRTPFEQHREAVAAGNPTSLYAFRAIERIFWLEGMRRGALLEPSVEAQVTPANARPTDLAPLFVEDGVTVPLWVVSALALCWRNYSLGEPDMATAFNLVSTKRGRKGRIAQAEADRRDREVAAQVYDLARRGSPQRGAVRAAVQQVAAARNLPETRVWAIWGRWKRIAEANHGPASSPITPESEDNSRE